MYKLSISVDASEQVEQAIPKFEAMLLARDIYLLKADYKASRRVIEIVLSETQYPDTLLVVTRAYSCFGDAISSINRV